MTREPTGRRWKTQTTRLAAPEEDGAMAALVTTDPDRDAYRATVQQRTLRLLFGTNIAGGIGTTIGVTVGGVLAARLGGVQVSGFASSASVIGAALLAVPVARLMSRFGRRPGLAAAYLIGAVGAGIVVLAAAAGSIWLMLLGMLLFGGGSTANLQARYSAVDLADPGHRARQLSLIVWATTIGAVAAPNFASTADSVLHRSGAPALTGPFIVSIGVFAVAAVLLLTLLRPDPLLTAQRLHARVDDPPRSTTGQAWQAIMASTDARLAIGAVTTGHLVMVAVMSMTPVHIMGGAHDDADLLRLVGIVLSVHVAGMYAFSPLVGWAADRFGRRTVIVTGVAVLLSACLVAGTAGHATPRLTAGLLLLGLGWSCMVVSGSTLLSESVPALVRPTAQGLSDLTMGVAAAVGGALAGYVVDLFSYGTLTVVAAIATVPSLALALRRNVLAGAPGEGV
jgi:MFS family permease